MSERYSKLFARYENRYACGAPVVIAAHALLRDEQTGEMLAQLKLQNIGVSRIKAATVELIPLDITEKPFGEPVRYQYLDLSAGPGEFFGSRVPVQFPDAAVRGYRAAVIEVIFEDNQIWTGTGAAWEPLHGPESLREMLGSEEVFRMYRSEYGGDCCSVFSREQDLWYCVCGTVNRQEEAECRQCHRKQAELEAEDPEKQKEQLDRQLRERQEAFDRRVAERKRMARVYSRRVYKIAGVLAAAAVVCTVGYLVLHNGVRSLRGYGAAEKLEEAGEWGAAAAAFQELDGYRDSAERADRLWDEEDRTSPERRDRYLRAVSLLENGEDEEAWQLFSDLGTYRDAEDYLERFTALLTDEYMDGRHLREFKYDAAGRLTDFTHWDIYDGFKDYVCRYYYDGDGFCIGQIRSDFSRVTGRPEDADIAYTYDDRGNCISETITYVGGDQAETQYFYDSHGNYVRQRQDDHRNGDWHECLYTYDSKGRCTREEHSNSDGLTAQTHHTYDDRGRRIREELSNSEGINMETLYTYDDQGNCIGRRMHQEWEDGQGTRNYSYRYSHIYGGDMEQIREVNRDLLHRFSWADE